MNRLPQETIKPRFLEALRECGRINRAARLMGTNEVTIRRWRKLDREFDEATRDARFQWEDEQGQTAEQVAIDVALNGWLEDVVHNGRRAFEVELDPVALADGKRKLRLRLDAEGEPIPIQVRKRSDKMLERVLARFAGWDQDSGFVGTDKGVELYDKEGQPIDFRELLAQAFGARAPEARVVDAQNVDANQEDKGELRDGNNNHDEGAGHRPDQPDGDLVPGGPDGLLPPCNA